MAAKGQAAVDRDVPAAMLNEVQALLQDCKPNEFLAPVETLGAKMSWRAIGSKARLGEALFRLVFTLFREHKLSARDAQCAVEQITLRGGAVKDMDVAFKDELSHDAKRPNVVDLADQVALSQQLAAKGLLGRHSMKKWAGETLADALKGVHWSTEGLLKDNEGELTPGVIKALVELGATPDSEPPRYHRERNTVAFYLANIPRPGLAHAFYSAWRPQSDDSSRARAKAKQRPRSRPVSKQALHTIVKTLLDVGRDLDTGERVQTRKERENLQRMLDCMMPRYLPILSEPNPADEPWKGSLVGGPMFASKAYPWPETKGYPHAPLVQLELDAITQATGVNVGAGFLQVWRPIGFRTRPDRMAPLEVRLIPRQLVKRQSTAGRAPPKYMALSEHPDYSWRLGRAQGPKVIKGWKRFGFAVPNPKLLDYYVRKSKLFSSESESILEASVHDVALELFGFPQPGRAFLKLPGDWLPLATIFGPMHGASRGKYNEPVSDISQVFFRCVGGQEFEYKGYSCRSFELA